MPPPIKKSFTHKRAKDRVTTFVYPKESSNFRIHSIKITVSRSTLLDFWWTAPKLPSIPYHIRNLSAGEFLSLTVSGIYSSFSLPLNIISIHFITIIICLSTINLNTYIPKAAPKPLNRGIII